MPSDSVPPDAAVAGSGLGDTNTLNLSEAIGITLRKGSKSAVEMQERNTHGPVKPKSN